MEIRVNATALANPDPASHLASGKLLVRAAIPEAGTEVVPTSLPQNSEANTPFKQNRVKGRVSNHDPDVICEVTFMRAREL